MFEAVSSLPPSGNKTFCHRYVEELKCIIKLAFPLVLTQLGISAIGFIDTMMAGHFSKTALAATAVGSSIFFPFIIAFSGIMMSVVPITAQLKGRGHEYEAPFVVKEALWIAFVFSGVIFYFVNHVDFLIKIMELSPEVSDVVRGYLQGASIGLPAAGCYLVLKSFVEGLGRTKPQMFFSFICVFFNYFANDILIHGKYGFPALGGAGCGWASGFTFWVYLICIVIYINFNKECRKLKVFSHFSLPTKKGISEVLRLGIPIGATLFMECSIFACITLFIGVLGPVIVGGHQITLNYSGLVFAIPLSIGMAITIRTGHAIGRRDALGARFSCITGSSFAMLIAVFTLCLTRFCPRLIALCYTEDAEVIAVAVSLLKIASLYQISDAMMVTCQSALRGYKDANVTFLLTFTAYWVITLPLGYTLSMTDWLIEPLGAKGFWISLIAGLTISGIFLCLRLNNVSKRYIKDFGQHNL